MLLNAFFRLNSYLAENTETVETKCDSLTNGCQLPAVWRLPRRPTPLPLTGFDCTGQGRPHNHLKTTAKISVFCLFYLESCECHQHRHTQTLPCAYRYTLYLVLCTWIIHLSPTGGSSVFFLLPNCLSCLIYISFLLLLYIRKDIGPTVGQELCFPECRSMHLIKVHSPPERLLGVIQALYFHCT